MRSALRWWARRSRHLAAARPSAWLERVRAMQCKVREAKLRKKADADGLRGKDWWDVVVCQAEHRVGPVWQRLQSRGLSGGQPDLGGFSADEACGAVLSRSEGCV